MSEIECGRRVGGISASAPTVYSNGIDVNSNIASDDRFLLGLDALSELSEVLRRLLKRLAILTDQFVVGFPVGGSVFAGDDQPSLGQEATLRQGRSFGIRAGASDASLHAQNP
jgi:hypothetical protein